MADTSATTRIHEPSILIRLNQTYRDGMTSHELYEATRGTWVVEERRHKAEYAFAVYRGVVMEVYVIEAWYPAGTTKYTTRVFKKTGVSDRWEFEGNIAEDAIRRKYVGQH